MDCIFCKILSGELDGYFIYEDKSHFAILDKYPVDTGHSLLITKGHHEKIIDMNESDIGEMFSKIPRITRAILKATNADAFSLGQNNGRAAKQIIPHVHVHIIPRYNSTGPVWTRRKIGNDTELSKLAKSIRQYLT